MERVRVLLANRPRMLRQLLRRLFEAQGDMEVVAEATDPVELLLTAGQTEADVVILTLPESGQDPGVSSQLLSEYPRLIVVALSPMRARACLYRQVIERKPLVGASDTEILQAIRQELGMAERSAGTSSEGEEQR